MPGFGKIAVALFLFLVFLNLLVLDFFVFKTRNEVDNLDAKLGNLSLDVRMLADKVNTAPLLPALPVPTTSLATPSVGLTPADLNRIAALASQMTTNAQNNQPAAPAPAVTREFVIPLGSGSTSQTSQWVDIDTAQAQINSANYSNIKAAYFEVVMHIAGATGEVKARLLETTVPFYYGEELKTQSTTGEFLSTPMILQAGNRTYKVRLYVQTGTAVLDSARIRIVTQ